MKTEICKDCMYSRAINKKGVWSRICKKNAGINIVNIDKCPMNYTQEDIDWIEEKEKEDSKRGYILYGITKRDLTEV